MEQGRQRELEESSFSKEIMQVCQSSVLLKSLRHVSERKWAVTGDFQQCGMCDQQRLRAFASRLNIL